MGTIRNLSARVSIAAKQWDNTKQTALRETAPDAFPALNKKQLRLGQRSDGQLIKPDLQSKVYSADKATTGGTAPFGTPDLFHTGAFYSEITTTVTKLSLKTFSLDLKAPKLELKYSPLIYGLNPANLTKYATETLKPVLFEKFRSQTVG